MARDGFAVDTSEVAELRRDVRAIDRAYPREINRVVRDAVGRVAQEAARTAPRDTGALAASYRPYVRGNTAGVYSRLEYAPVIEYGGTIEPRGTPITFQRREIVTRAVMKEADNVVDEMGDGLVQLAKRHGWR